MKPRHTAPLALIGWYLIIPSSSLPPGVAYSQPLSKWAIVRGFDTDLARDRLCNFSFTEGRPWSAQSSSALSGLFGIASLSRS
jgi:hypothetical protein